MTLDRVALVRQGLRLNYLTLVACSLEAVASLTVGGLTGSIALVGFGFDSDIELTSSGAAQWRLRADFDERDRHRVERRTVRIIGWCFLALPLYASYASGRPLIRRERPQRSVVGILMLTEQRLRL